MSLDTFMDDFGRELRRAAAPKRRRTRRRLVLVLPAATGLAAVGVIALPRGDGVDAIAAARAALAPENDIVHMVIDFEPPATAKGPRIVMPKTEQWYSAGQDRWRTRIELGNPRAPGKARPLEQIFSRDRVRIYDAKRDVVTIFRGIRFVGGRWPGVAGGDPATELRKELDAGDVRDDGIVTHGGKQVRRLVREEKVGKRTTQRFVYYMDPQTFAPLGGRMYFTFNQKRTMMTEFVISGYERIPLTASSQQLLRFDKTPDTKYVWRDVTRPGGSSSARRPARRQG